MFRCGVLYLKVKRKCSSGIWNAFAQSGLSLVRSNQAARRSKVVNAARNIRGQVGRIFLPATERSSWDLRVAEHCNWRVPLRFCLLVGRGLRILILRASCGSLSGFPPGGGADLATRIIRHL